jgi:hypothetical protein
MWAKYAQTMATAVYIVVMARKMSFDTAERKLLLKSQNNKHHIYFPNT